MILQRILWVTVCAAALGVQAAPKNGKNQAIYSQAIEAVQQNNHAKAFALLKPLAIKGDATAQNNIAVLYEEGLGVAKNEAEAFQWYEKAAKQGLAEAQFMAGLYHAEGRGGLPQNYRQAFVWYQKAAKKGHAEAQNNLAMRYASGTGVKQNIAKAKYWFAQADRQGHHTASKALQALEELQKSGEIR